MGVDLLADYEAVLHTVTYDNKALDLAKFLAHSSWLVTQPGVLAHLPQRLPEHVGREADQDMG